MGSNSMSMPMQTTNQLFLAVLTAPGEIRNDITAGLFTPSAQAIWFEPALHRLLAC